MKRDLCVLWDEHECTLCAGRVEDFLGDLAVVEADRRGEDGDDADGEDGDASGYF